MKNILELTDFRCQVAAMYARIRSNDDAAKAHTDFVKTRNDMFAQHPQSALNETQKADFTGLEYFPYNPAFRFLTELNYDVETETIDILLRDDGVFKIRRIASLNIPFPKGDTELSLFWIEGYGGGLFLPFQDATSGQTTYGGGRYLLDTIKHADLGSMDDKLILDFNFSYNPSCAYNNLWDCPLAPFENRIDVGVEVGEKIFS